MSRNGELDAKGSVILIGQASRVLAIRGLRAAAWPLAAGGALFSIAMFLSGLDRATLDKGYLVAAGVATAIALLVSLPGALRRSRWQFVCAIVLGALVAACATFRGRIVRVEEHWGQVSTELQARGLDTMLRVLEQAHTGLVRRARLAAEAPQDPAQAFEFLRRLQPGGGAEQSTILFRRGQPQIWSGAFRVEPGVLSGDGPGISFTEFFVTMHAPARASDGSLALATVLLEARPPANQLVEPLGAEVARAGGLTGFTFFPPGAAVEGARPFVVQADTLALVRPLPLVQGQVRLQLVEQLVATGASLLALAAAIFLAVCWRRYRRLLERAASLSVVLACGGLLPLNLLSNRTRLFDPAIYFSSFGGPFTANAGILLVSGALILLALFALLRSSVRLRSRTVAGWIVIGVAVLGPFLLRDLARGISPSGWGASTTLWLSIQAGLFVSGCALLLAGVSAGRAALGTWRGFPPAVAFAIAVVAAALGPIVWEAPGRYPAWYPALWIVAIAALALARPVRGFMLSVASVAALGAATLTWSASIKQRVALAESDVRGVSNIDPTASVLLERFGRSLAASEAARDRAALLRQYVTSDLASAEYPVELFTWNANDSIAARLSLSRITTNPQLLLEAVRAARSRRLVVQQEVRFVPGAQMLVAAPHADGWVTTALVAPRSRLIADDPFLSLVGLTQEAAREPPYTLSVPELQSRGAGPASLIWERRGSKLHGDVTLPAYGAGVLAHIEVEMRGLAVLLQRGALVLLIDLVLFVVLWALAVHADGALSRWIRTRRHRWAQSYRARLTLVLFAFFVVPAIVFAVWSQRGILAGDRQSRELLLSEMLRAAEREVSSGGLASAGARFDAPLFIYENGRLVGASDSLFVQLAPLGRRLPAPVFLTLELGDAFTTSHFQNVGSTRALVGYRLIRGPSMRRVVLAAPARTDQLEIDRRRRDLGVLVLFATATGALAALWLSGIAARQLARPIGILQSAARAIARGEHRPPLPGEPRSEFAAVFTSFRTMAEDLSESRSALLQAQRRTEAILRNVASGVIAFTADGRVSLANPRSTALLGSRLEPGTMLGDQRLANLEPHVRPFLLGSSEEQEFDEEIGGRQLHGRLTRLTTADGGAVLTLDDVSEVARVQRVLAWGQMARQVAHEIKNPLTPIRLGVQHLRRAHTDKREDFDRILESNVARILSEIDRLDEIARAFSRYGVAPAQRSSVAPIDVGDIARDVVELERMGESEVEWRYSESEGSLMALASEDELREVLLNLLENARLAGARVISMNVRRNGTTLVATVEDDGHGIPDAVLPRIFEPHFSTRSSGSGLGLAISRKLIEGWGGQIDVASTFGSGTRVTIFLAAPREL